MGATAEPASHADARAVLEEHGLGVEEIVKVDSDCVLYVSKTGRAVTAWLTVTEADTNTGRALKVAVEAGFVADRGNPTPVQRANPSARFSLNRNTQLESD